MYYPSIPYTGNPTGKKPDGADIEIKDSSGKVYWYNPTTKVLYRSQTTTTFSGSHVNWHPIADDDSLKQDLLVANASKIPGFFQESSSYQTLSVSPKQTALRYPYDMRLSEDSDYVLFDFYEYTPPFSSEVDLPEVARPINWKLVNYNNSVTASAKQAEGYNQLLLYMPSDVQDQYRADWEGKAFGAMTAGVLAAAGRAGTIEKLNTLAEAGKTQLKNLKVNAAASLVSGLAQSITGDSITPQDVFATVGGAIRNPNVELLFTSMNLRTFDLTFKMSPYHQDDEKNIRGIINTFRKAMLPKYDGVTSVFDIKNDGVQAAFIKVPNLCKVAYMRGAGTHPHLPSYKLCAITDMNVNYTPDNTYTTFRGGGPVAYELKVSFMETKLVFAEDFGEGRMT